MLGLVCVCFAVLCCLRQHRGQRGGGLRGAKKHTIYREIQKFKALKRIKHAEYIPGRVLYFYMSMGVNGDSFPLSLRAFFLRSSGLRQTLIPQSKGCWWRVDTQVTGLEGSDCKTRTRCGP